MLRFTGTPSTARENRMKRSYQHVEVILWSLVRFVPVFLCLGLLTPLALAQTSQPTSRPLRPKPIREKGYQLTMNWDFGVNIRNESELRREFYTRYIYSNGKLDYLNDEWQRYRDKPFDAAVPTGPFRAQHSAFDTSVTTCFWMEVSIWSPEYTIA